MSHSGNCPPPAERVVFYAARTARHGLKSMKKGGADLSLPLLESLLAVRRPTARAAATYSAFSSAMSFAFESTPRLETLSSYTFLPVGCCSSHSFSARSSQLLA